LAPDRQNSQSRGKRGVPCASHPTSWAAQSAGSTGRGAFTHTAYNDFEIVAANLLDGEHRRVSDRIPACALDIDPPLGRVGMTEAQARATGRRCSPPSGR
jgi:hypothetical protein